LRIADSITRLPCACRYFTRGLTNQRYCFGLGIDRGHVLGKFPASSACLEVIEKDEAISLIRKFDEEGLMHSVWAGVTPYVSGICNCDGDCEAILEIGGYHPSSEPNTSARWTLTSALAARSVCASANLGPSFTHPRLAR
jgi:hypothetical protein